ncbi:hypothetical protein B7E00_03905 [Aeromonas hydrophila]|nr:hypothetical protein B7E00_03905 [Aeromonas hydrophila]
MLVMSSCYLGYLSFSGTGNQSMSIVAWLSDPSYPITPLPHYPITPLPHYPITPLPHFPKLLHRYTVQPAELYITRLI